jgi:hypothetical protein
MTDAINGGKSIAEVASQHQLSVLTSVPLTRRTADAKTPPGLVREIFGAKPGGAVFARGVDGYIVAQVKDVLPPDPAQQEKQITQFSAAQITPALREDLLEEFGAALRQRYPVTTNQEAVDALTSGGN